MLDRVSDLVVLGTHPRVMLIAVGVEFRKRLKAFVGFAMVDEPSEMSLVMDRDSMSVMGKRIPGRLGEEHDE